MVLQVLHSFLMTKEKVEILFKSKRLPIRYIKIILFTNQTVAFTLGVDNELLASLTELLVRARKEHTITIYNYPAPEFDNFRKFQSWHFHYLEALSTDSKSDGDKNSLNRKL